MRLGKSGVVVAPAGPRLLPRGGSPSPAPSLPSSAPSRQERSLPIPSSAPCPARGEVARGRGPGPAPEPPLSVLCSSASIPGRVPPPALETLRVRVPQPRSIAARGTRLLSPNPLGCAGSSPPALCPVTPWHLQGHPGLRRGRGWVQVAREPSLPSPPGAGTALPGFWGALLGCAALPVLPMSSAGGRARGWGGGGLGSAWATCNHFCIN